MNISFANGRCVRERRRLRISRHEQHHQLPFKRQHGQPGAPTCGRPACHGCDSRARGSLCDRVRADISGGPTRRTEASARRPQRNGARLKSCFVSRAQRRTRFASETAEAAGSSCRRGAQPLDVGEALGLLARLPQVDSLLHPKPALGAAAQQLLQNGKRGLSPVFPSCWRRRWDSNPRCRFCPHTPLAGEHLRPLGHVS
jgi:hypothetical protein